MKQKKRDVITFRTFQKKEMLKNLKVINKGIGNNYSMNDFIESAVMYYLKTFNR